MLFKLIVLAVLAALWWGALWFALPIAWLQGTMPSFIAIHVAPPLLAVAAWWSGKRIGSWRADRAEKRAKDAQAAEKEAALQADMAAHQALLKERHVHVQCRAVWAGVAQAPDWFAEGASQCWLLEYGSDAFLKNDLKDALISSLTQTFEEAFTQCEATVWLPVKLASSHPQLQGWVEQAWHQAVKGVNVEHFPPNPDCSALSGIGVLPDRLIALFEDDPNLPAVIVVDMDSPLAEMGELQKPDPEAKLGHAVVAMLFSPPGQTSAGVATSEPSKDPLLPYWERELDFADSPLWQRIPPSLRPTLWKNEPFATLHRSHTARELEPKRESVLTQQISGTIRQASINANLRDLAFKPKEPEKEKTQEESEAEQEAEEKPLKLGSLDLGWFVHNSGSSFRLGALSNALRHCGCETDPLDEAGNLEKEFGDVGTAQGALILAEALVRVAQLQKPVLAACFNEDNSINVGLVRPFSEPEPEPEPEPENPQAA
jgi:hypothetical protein